MKPEIDQIISCDEAARATVDSAKKEAEDLVAKAKRDGNTLQSDLKAIESSGNNTLEVHITRSYD